MTKHDQELRRRAYEEMERKEHIVKMDPYRQHFHLMPPVGLMNDPNGVIHWKGIYHLFFQWQPFHTGHGAKFWGALFDDGFGELGVGRDCACTKRMV